MNCTLNSRLEPIEPSRNAYELATLICELEGSGTRATTWAEQKSGFDKGRDVVPNHRR